MQPVRQVRKISIVPKYKIYIPTKYITYLLTYSRKKNKNIFKQKFHVKRGGGNRNARKIFQKRPPRAATRQLGEISGEIGDFFLSAQISQLIFLVNFAKVHKFLETDF